MTVRFIPAYFLIFILQLTPAYSENLSDLSNLDLLSKLSRASMSSLVNQLGEKKIDTIFVPIAEGESNRYFNSLFVSNCSNAGISVMIADRSDQKYPYLDYKVEFKTEYRNHTDSDSIIRLTRIALVGEITEVGGKLSPANFDKVLNESIISREQAANYNSEVYSFANSKIPEPEKTFWSDIVQPIAFIGTAIISVVLLFTVRSK